MIFKAAKREKREIADFPQFGYISVSVCNKQPRAHPLTEKIWEIDNLPNRLTLFRILLVPVVLVLLMPMDFIWPQQISQRTPGSWSNYLSAVFFIVASITDFLDGYFARSRNLVTVFGSFLDPVADKFLVVSSLIALLAMDRINPLVVVILVIRELYITSLRLLAADHNLKLPVGQMGKWKTATQMIAIPFLMAYDTFHLGPILISMPFIGSLCIYTAALFSIYSALEYSLGLMNKIRKLRKKNRL